MDNQEQTQAEAAQPNYVSPEQLTELLSNFKNEIAGMVSGAVNKVKKENQVIQEQLTTLVTSLNNNQAPPSTEADPSKPELPKDNVAEPVTLQVQELQKQIDKLRQENEQKEQERLKVVAEADKEKATNKFLSAVRDKVNNPNHLLGALLFDGTVKYDPEKKDYVLENKNQYGEVELVPSLDKLDDILKRPDYQSHIPARPGNGLGSNPPSNNQQRPAAPIGSEIPTSLMTDPNFLGKLISNLSEAKQ